MQALQGKVAQTENPGPTGWELGIAESLVSSQSKSEQIKYSSVPT